MISCAMNEMDTASDLKIIWPLIANCRGTQVHVQGGNHLPPCMCLEDIEKF